MARRGKRFCSTAPVATLQRTCTAALAVGMMTLSASAQQQQPGYWPPPPGYAPGPQGYPSPPPGFGGPQHEPWQAAPQPHPGLFGGPQGQGAYGWPAHPSISPPIPPPPTSVDPSAFAIPGLYLPPPTRQAQPAPPFAGMTGMGGMGAMAGTDGAPGSVPPPWGAPGTTGTFVVSRSGVITLYPTKTEPFRMPVESGRTDTSGASGTSGAAAAPAAPAQAQPSRAAPPEKAKSSKR